MTQLTFPLGDFFGKAPGPQPSSDDPPSYAWIWCLGTDGSLVLNFLRPEATNYLDSLGEVDQTRTNSFDPTSKYGVAYFNAAAYDWLAGLLGSGKALQMQVDDVYPGGNRIFYDWPMLPPTQRAVPDVVTWLNQNLNVLLSLTWNEPNQGGLHYGDWSTQKQQDFLAAFAAAWNHQPQMFDDPPANLGNYDAGETVLEADHAWKLFCAHAAYCLAVEMDHRVPWSITGYNSTDLQRLLHAGNMFRYDPTYNGYGLVPGVLPAPPEFNWGFLSAYDLIGADRITTIANLLNWCRYNLSHIPDLHTTASLTMQACWGYAGAPPASRIIQGTICTNQPEYGVRHYTAGCAGTTDFLQAVLRTVNIPVERVMAGGHTMPHFTVDDLYLSHGDDPYDWDSKCTPPFDAGLLLIDSATFNNWFGPGVSQTDAEKNVGMQPMQLAIQYFSDLTVNLYYQDKQAGTPPQDGLVYNELLKSSFPDFNKFNALYPNFWTGLDTKLVGFYYANQAFASRVPPLPPGCRDFATRMVVAYLHRRATGIRTTVLMPRH